MCLHLSKELIKFVLGINDKELFFLIKDSMYNEILMERDGFYFFSFKESVIRFQKEADIKIKAGISKKIINYFDDKTINLIPILEGIVQHANYVKNHQAVRRFCLIIVERYSSLNQHQEAFKVLCRILELDFGGSFQPQQKEYINDLMLLIKKSEWGLEENISSALKYSVRSMPDIAEKHLLIGVFYFILEKYRIALSRFKKAEKLAMTGRIKIMTLLKMAEVYNAKNDILNLGLIIDILDKIELTEEFQAKVISLKALYMGFSGNQEGAINLIEDTLPRIGTSNNADFFSDLGTLHNSLAFLYHRKKMLSDAEKNFQIARNLWERIESDQKIGHRLQ